MRFSKGILGNSHWLWNERDVRTMWGLRLLKKEAKGREEASSGMRSSGLPLAILPQRALLRTLQFCESATSLFCGWGILPFRALYGPSVSSCFWTLRLFTYFLILKAKYTYFRQFHKHKKEETATFPGPQSSRVAEPWFWPGLAAARGWVPQPTTYCGLSQIC